MSSLLLGVIGLNVLFLVLGYCVLALSLRGVPVATWASFAGVALLLGAGVTGVSMGVLTVAGARATPTLLGAVAAVVAVAGTALAAFAPDAWRDRFRAPVAAVAGRPGRVALVVATVAGAVVAGICVVALVGGFRSSPWLDDTWFFWLPKGVIVDRVGLRPGLFTENSQYLAVKNADYPLWWSILLEQNMRFVGKVDLRAVNGQLGILEVSFLAAVVRLLWSRVRPSILLVGVLLLAASPEFVRQAQGGGADLPLAFYLALFVVAAAAWLADGVGFWLLLMAVFGAAVLAIKTEGLPEVVLTLVILALVGWRYAGRRGSLRAFAGAAVVALATAVPWFAWRNAHGIQNDVSFAKAVNPKTLSDQVGRVEPAVRTLARHLFAPHGWILLMHIAIVLCLAGFVVRRRLIWLAPLLLLASQFALLVWVYWADPLNLGYRLATSSYRVVDPLLLLAAVSIPVVGEALARALAERRQRDVTPPPAGSPTERGVR